MFRRQPALLSGYRGVIALRWLGITLLAGSTLTTRLSVLLPVTIAVGLIAAGYNLAAMALQRRGDVTPRFRVIFLCADFAGCLLAMLSSGSISSGPTESIGLLLIGVEAVVLFNIAGFVWLSIAIPPAVALAAWNQGRVTHMPSDVEQWAFTWATFMLLLWLIALRGKHDAWLRGELSRLATTDDLTGLANRRSFRTVLANELSRSARTQRPLCLLSIDLDRFKRINDTLGHGAGDEVLAHVGELLMSGLHRSGIDFAARVGGEEFAVILPETDVAGGRRAAERLRLTVVSRADDIRTTVSIGVAASHSDDDTESILRAADRALYAAKDGGRNCVRVAGERPHAEVRVA